jgi:hypothetical protein
MWLAVIVVVVGALVASPRILRWRSMVSLAHAGAQAAIEPVSGDALNARQQELLVQMGRLGFTAEPPIRVRLAEKPPSVFASARDEANVTWFRGMAIEGTEGAGLTLISYFPGGRLVSATQAAQAVDPTEVVQCIPDGAPGRLLALHQEALDAVAARSLRPVPLPRDLAPLVRDEWRTESAILLEGGPVRQIARARTFWRAPTVTPPISQRADLDEVVTRLAAPRPS